MSDADNIGMFKTSQFEPIYPPLCCEHCGRKLSWKQIGKVNKVFDEKTGNPISVWIERLVCDNPKWFHKQPKFDLFQNEFYFEKVISLDLVTEKKEEEINWEDAYAI